VTPYRCRPHERPGSSGHTSLVAATSQSVRFARSLVTRYDARHPPFTCLSAHVSGRETRVHAGPWHASSLTKFIIISDYSQPRTIVLCHVIISVTGCRQLRPSYCHSTVCLSTLCFARLAIQVWGKRPGNSKQRQQIFLLYTASRPVKRDGRKDVHTSSSNVEVKNVWSYTSSPAYVFMALCLIQHRRLQSRN
jgi:hypothetical protein